MKKNAKYDSQTQLVKCSFKLKMNKATIAALKEAEELSKPGVEKVFKTIDELRQDWQNFSPEK